MMRCIVPAFCAAHRGSDPFRGAAAGQNRLGFRSFVRIHAPRAQNFRFLLLLSRAKENDREEGEDEDGLFRGLKKFFRGEDAGGDDLGIRLGDFLDPSVDNVLALVLTGLLGLAVLQITWQLLLVAAAIIISGLKYTVLAAFLVAFVIFFL